MMVPAVGTMPSPTRAYSTEIEGSWRINAEAFGRFLMIRSRGATEQVARKRFVEV
jgi:hypothetical protein